MTLQIYTSNGWIDLPGPITNDTAIYRLKPGQVWPKPAPKKGIGYVNIYRDRPKHFHNTLGEAREAYREGSSIARVRVEWTEGQFDDEPAPKGETSEPAFEELADELYTWMQAITAPGGPIHRNYLNQMAPNHMRDRIDSLLHVLLKEQRIARFTNCYSEAWYVLSEGKKPTPTDEEMADDLYAWLVRIGEPGAITTRAYINNHAPEHIKGHTSALLGLLERTKRIKREERHWWEEAWIVLKNDEQENLSFAQRTERLILWMQDHANSCTFSRALLEDRAPLKGKDLDMSLQHLLRKGQVTRTCHHNVEIWELVRHPRPFLDQGILAMIAQQIFGKGLIDPATGTTDAAAGGDPHLEESSNRPNGLPLSAQKILDQLPQRAKDGISLALEDMARQRIQRWMQGAQ